MSAGPHSDRLLVHHFGREVGVLTRDTSGVLYFAYAANWLNSAGAFALAANLPLQPGTTATSFFSNLLPEAGARARIARSAGLSAENDFEFLRLFGADCAGSLQISSTAGDSWQASGDDLLYLTADDGPKLATRTGFAGFFSPGGRVRLSLAGAQNKLAVVKTDEGIAIPLDGRPSTHILKLPNPDFRGLVENEALVLSLARELGLPVVHHEIVRLGDVSLLLIERYDRALQDGDVLRLHQQDLCQATGLSPGIKYESEGGPSLKTTFDVVRAEVVDPLTATQSLLAWTVFNVLIHNADAHAKNVSILRSLDGRQALAPFYDLVCTGAYDLDHAMAMAIGGQFDPGAISERAWVAFASDIGVGKSLVLRTVKRMAAQIPGVLATQIAAFETANGTLPRRAQLERVIRRRARKAQQLLE